MKFLAFLLTLSRCVDFLTNWKPLQFIIFLLVSSLFFPGNGFLPVRSMKVITPRLQISTFSLYIYAVSISGAIYRRLPHPRVRPKLGSKSVVNPKSVTLTEI